MALNWTMLSEDGSKPVPLPGEKVFFSAERCSLALDFKNVGVKWKAEGTAFVTSQRVVFARQPPLPAPADPSLASAHLRTLSVPLSQFLDTRYLIPVFGAPYYEAAVVPSPDGGLPQRSPHGGVRTGLLKIWFNEGGGITFRDAVEEVKSRREEGSRHGEALPLYEPPSESSGPSMTGSRRIDSPGTNGPAPPDTNPVAGAAEGAAPRPSVPRPSRSDSLPHPDLMAAAQVAREAEERERDAERLRAQGRTSEPGGAGGAPGSFENSDQPPAYEA